MKYYYLTTEGQFIETTFDIWRERRQNIIDIHGHGYALKMVINRAEAIVLINTEDVRLLRPAANPWGV